MASENRTHVSSEWKPSLFMGEVFITHILLSPKLQEIAGPVDWLGASGDSAVARALSEQGRR